MACKFETGNTVSLHRRILIKSSIVLMNYREDGVTPYIIVWKHGLKSIKV